MKKMFFSAVACMAFVGSTFAANGEKPVQPKLPETIDSDCIWNISVYDSKGNTIATKRHVGDENAVDCLDGAKADTKAYEAKYPDMIVKYVITGHDDGTN